MAAVIAPREVWADRRRRVAELRQRQGFARQVLDFYGALIGAQERSYRDAAQASPGAADIPSYVAEVVVPRILDVSLSLGPERMRSDLIHRLQQEDVRDMVQRWIDGKDQPSADRFLARASLEPVFEALDPALRAACAGPRDARHCRYCGGPPQLSYFDPAPEHLATGGRRLLCARCGASWGYPRMTCAGCGEQESAKLAILSEMGTASGESGSVVRGLSLGSPKASPDAFFPHMRIEACESCRMYVLNVDLDAEPRAVPLVDEMAAIPLDLVARDRGFTKITSNLMGF